ncbi:outer membrane protein assembly factor BamB family protein [Natrarchaeobaculum sulfurireducens]|uniref:WD40/PQQ-like beta propeller repeat containing protein n=1 Tax=Natrarchaeobaculum sulfurireducens TaxID=2044521 RepID=A0A346PFN7_9EURY|nr:PQQ-binding-like beta-propeller repeat protein [Natrarchaeobaculum sulfurireducens]AXR78332.1 WD40/PQQ-like beta propeller repeat containing protein [Natrarchaeobaculum sulfurireducens]
MAAYRHTRRRWLATCAGATAGLAAIAGCSDETDTSSLDDPGATASDGDYGDWPMERYNATNRLSVPHTGLDSEPEVLWTAELTGATRPPVVYDDTAFVNHGYDTCTAININDGEMLWEVDTDGSEAIAVSEMGLLVGDNGLTVLDRDNGEALWTSKSDQIITSIRLYEDAIYAGSEDSVVTFNEHGEEIVSFDTPDPVQSLAVDQDHVYVRCREDPDIDDFVLLGYSRDSGNKLWEHEITQAQQWFDDRVSRTFPVVESKIYTATDDYLLEIDGSDGDTNKITEFDSVPWTRPTVNDHIAYIERGSMAYNVETGETPETWSPEHGSENPLVFADGIGYGISANLTDPLDLVAVDPNSGELLWQKETERDSPHYPVILNGIIILPLDDLGLIAYS